MSRPDHLPDYSNPPLNEVVVGVQFAPVPDYTSVDACKIWELFKAQYPKVRELPQLPRNFETFGGSNKAPSFQMQLGRPAGSRLWFISPDEGHLIQYQPDRFLLNWRKQSDSQSYPHFEGIISVFEQSLKTLSNHLSSEFSYEININQAEVEYLNIIPVARFADAKSWFACWDSKLDIESLNMGFNEVIYHDDNTPHARLKYGVESVFGAEGKEKAFRMSLSFAGKPILNDINSAVEFLRKGREAIVTRFDQITTSEAHDIWRKK
ncbi:MAG: TIGR04255 family protein [Thiolinea sp.]